MMTGLRSSLVVGRGVCGVGLGGESVWFSLRQHPLMRIVDDVNME